MSFITNYYNRVPAIAIDTGIAPKLYLINEPRHNAYHDRKYVRRNSEKSIILTPHQCYLEYRAHLATFALDDEEIRMSYMIPEHCIKKHIFYHSS